VKAAAFLGKPGQTREEFDRELAAGLVPEERMLIVKSEEEEALDRLFFIRRNTFNNFVGACQPGQVQIAAQNSCFNSCQVLCSQPAPPNGNGPPGGPFDAATPCL